MTALEKLNKLYEIKTKLHPLTMVLITGFVEVQDRKLNAHDIKFVNDVYPGYYKKNGQLLGSFR